MRCLWEPHGNLYSCRDTSPGSVLVYTCCPTAIINGALPHTQVPWFLYCGHCLPFTDTEEPSIFLWSHFIPEKTAWQCLRPRHHTCLLPWPWAPKWGKTCSAQPTGEGTSANSMVHRSDCRPPGFWPRQPGGEVWKEETQL